MNLNPAIEPWHEVNIRSDSHTYRFAAHHRMGEHPNTQNICPMA
jgi:hypothetical protein